ncbi:MAG: ferredoxin--NADP reductase [Acidimicrobiales bacterium]
MAITEPSVPIAAPRDHGFHKVRIARVVRETEDARTFVFDIPDELRVAFGYEAGQFCTFRVWIDGEPYLRSYSISSAPGVDEELQVTVKRVPGGIVSNRLYDTLNAGDHIETTCPAGVFCLGPGDSDVVAICAGSGVTPVLSIVKHALAATGRNVRVLYANRDRDSVIFAAALDELGKRYGPRLEIIHHLDVEQGFIDGATVRGFIRGVTAEYFVCGPGPFMDLVEETLLEVGVEDQRIHIEVFTPAERAERLRTSDPVDPPCRVTIELDGRTESVDHHPGTTILQTARQIGMAPPFSCESGSCATCMAKVTVGTATMYVNNALTEDEVKAGWVLTCQALPTTPSVHVVYDAEEG